MKKILRVMAAAMFIPLLSGCDAIDFDLDLRPVNYVDVNAYMGKWYQISAYETFFNRDLVGVTALYSLNPDGTVNVINRGFKGTLDGEPDGIAGTAVVVDSNTNAKLNVSFPGIPNFTANSGNYWIVVLDDAPYSYAAVADPLGSTLFILSRTPTMDQATYQNILSMLSAMKLDIAKLKLTPQPEA